MPTTVADLRRFKREGHRFATLTSHDFQTAQIFDEAGVPLLFVGDTLAVTVSATRPPSGDDGRSDSPLPGRPPRRS